MIVIDASVVTKLLTMEADADLAVTRVAREPSRTAPDWLHAEIASALSKKVRYAGLPLPVANEMLSLLPTVMDDLVATAPLLPAAFILSVELRHALYDCIYLALALEKHCILLTADRKFFSAVSDSRRSAHVELLS